MNGNHEMLSGGGAFFKYIDEKRVRSGGAAGVKRQRQEGSYFALTSPKFQIIGIDTAYHTSIHGAGRYANDDLKYWLKARLDEGRALGQINILLSGDEPYSVGSAGTTELFGDVGKLVDAQLIDLWFWGNTHYCALFDRSDRTPFLGSCIGHGGYPYDRMKESSKAGTLTSVRWLETRARFPDSTGVRQDRGNNGYVMMTLNHQSGIIELDYRDWRREQRHAARLGRVDGKLRFLATPGLVLLSSPSPMPLAVSGSNGDAFGTAFATPSDGPAVVGSAVEAAYPSGGGKDSDSVSIEVLLHKGAQADHLFAHKASVLASASGRLRAVNEFKIPQQDLEAAVQQLHKAGFKVLHKDQYTISAEGERGRFEENFGTRLKLSHRPRSFHRPELGSVSFYEPIRDSGFSVPHELSHVQRAYVQPKATYMSPSAMPPRVSYWHLRVPDDLAVALGAVQVHRQGCTGRGVKVAMVDTGFAKDPYYQAHGYKYDSMLAPDARFLDRDETGHGTAEAANVFAAAPDVTFMGIKSGDNSTLAFKMAAQDPDVKVITCSWGFSVDSPGAEFPNRLKPIELAIADAVARGIVVIFSAGNGHYSFPGSHPDVISVGGVHLRSDGTLEASNYASSFDSAFYLERHVPDVCGLVGMQPRAAYLMLPTDPESSIDVGMAGRDYPEKDETLASDGWACISGTSAAAPQAAGLAALLLQKNPRLSPAEVKAKLQQSATDVLIGTSSMGQAAARTPDAATGFGLVNALAAYALA